MSQQTFERFSRYVEKNTGIKMPPAKKTMMQSRMMKRMRTRKIGCFEEYYEYVFSPEGLRHELPKMIDAITTNKTDFFREPAHFDYLQRTALPSVESLPPRKSRRTITVWSAGCSSGEEPYTLAMLLADYTQAQNSLHFSILATDISTNVLNTALQGVYSREKSDPIPAGYKRKYLMFGKNGHSGMVRIVPELRNTVHFVQLNLMDEEFNIPNNLDIAFCRNVIIYFDRQTQHHVLRKISHHLKPGGYLFVGHSETLNGQELPLRQVAPTIYRKI